MKLIVKNEEPEEWKEFRQTEEVGYEAKPCLRQSLYKEQGGICAYCMQRLEDELSVTAPIKVITTKGGKTERVENKVEHIKCRDAYPELQLDYSNMVMCCFGKTMKDGEHKFCDKAKGNQDISFTPFDANFINTLSYKNYTGAIKSSNPIWNKELNDTLNLNDSLLMLNRKAVLKGLRQSLDAKKWKCSEIKRQIEIWDHKDAQGLFKPYCGMVVWYLKKKLNQARK